MENENKKEVPEEHKKRMLVIKNEIKYIIQKMTDLCSDKKIPKKDQQRIMDALIKRHLVPFGDAFLDMYVQAHGLRDCFTIVAEPEKIKIETVIK